MQWGTKEGQHRFMRAGWQKQGQPHVIHGPKPSMAAPVVLWVASYSHGARRLRLPGGHGRHIARLPQEAWAEARFREAGVSLEVDSHAAARAQVTVQGLVSLSRVFLRSVLAAWGEEAFYLWEYLGRPQDAFTVHVKEQHRITHPFQIHSRRRLPPSGRARDISNVYTGEAISITIGGEGMFFTLDDLVPQVELESSPGNICSGGFVLQRHGVPPECWGQVPVLLLPEPVSVLLFAGRWRELLLLARWPAATLLWPDWPPADWVACRRGQHWARTQEPASLADLRRLLADLRRWAPRIIQGAGAGSALGSPGSSGEPSAEPASGAGEREAEAEEEELRLEAHAAHLEATLLQTEQRRQPLTRQRVRHPAAWVIRCLLASQCLREQRKLRNVLEHHLLPLLPEPLRVLARNSFDANGWSLPAWDYSHQLLLDTAVMTWRRRHLATQPRVRYCFADASPQGDRDWFIIVVASIAFADRIPCMDAVEELSTNVGRVAACDGDGDGDGDSNGDDDEPYLRRLRRPDASEEEAAPSRRSQLFEVIQRGLQTHTCVPVALGLGHQSLEHKVAALLYSFWAETGFPEPLASYLSSFASCTTDMGVEFGINEFQSVNLNTLVPPWVGGAALLPDDGSPVVETALPFLFQKSLPVAGALHIFANAAQQVDRALTMWSTFYTGCKTLEALICHPGRMQLFVSRCLEGTQWEAKAYRFRKKFPHMYEKRWGQVLLFCTRLRGIIGILKALWDPRKVETLRHGRAPAAAGKEDEGEEADADLEPLNVDAISRVLSDPFFRGYLELVVTLNGVLESMSAWMEQCPCHEHLQQMYRDHVPQAVLRSEFGVAAAATGGGGGLSCPVRGCRAPELAAGALSTLLGTTFSNALGELAAVRGGMTEAEWACLLSEWARARAHISYVLTLKLHHWTELPWLLCVLGHPDESTAREGTHRILQQFDRCPVNAVHHRLTLQFAAPDSPLRPQLEAFSAGTPRRELPELHGAAAGLLFIPVTERRVEGPHGLVKKSLTYKHHSPLSVAMAVRRREIMRDFGTEASLQELAACADEVRSVRRIPKLFGFARHPWLNHISHSAGTHAWVSLVAKIIYRCDDVTQFQDCAAARVSHVRAKRARVRAEQQAVPAAAPPVLDRDHVLAHAMTDHFRRVAKPSSVFSLPQCPGLGGGRRLSLTSLVGQLMPVVPPPPPPSAVGDRFELDADMQDADAPALPASGDVETVETERRVFFRILHTQPALQKVQEKTPAAGGRVQRCQMSVVLLQGDSAMGCLHVHTDVGDSTAATSLMSFVGSNMAWLREALREHAESTEVVYSLTDTSGDFCNNAAHLSRMVDAFILAEALPGLLGVCDLPLEDQDDEDSDSNGSSTAARSPPHTALHLSQLSHSHSVTGPCRTEKNLLRRPWRWRWRRGASRSGAVRGGD